MITVSIPGTGSKSASSTAPAHVTKWDTQVSMLRCVECHAPLQYKSAEALGCTSCSHTYAIKNQVLHVTEKFEGNNAIAADYYNGSLWPKFRFWEWIAHMPRGGERKARNEVLRHLPSLSGTKLLDVAMGDGRNMPQIPLDCQVWGVDISRVLLEKTKRDFPQHDTTLVVGEAEQLPFPDATFDNMFSLGALNHVNDPGRALKEMARVVKPGGMVVVADEIPDLPNRQIAHKLGLRKLQRWILAKMFFLGPMSDVILENTDLKIEPLVADALVDWKIHSIWGNLGYVIAGKPKK
ncbi:class I SAM-dependent methyltransferase [Anatilimnocola floriformis]|uniref:class I SAM-dependent methyltransferase n=1 Tax=Anatilimnocola floriformis TaxID=2948575 RepID=UPI0020C351CB|nr:class I SAM-dependent methyltransferase [Anatilimnocola floriformis]